MGKGSSQPQPTSTSQTSIPEYAKPYVERMLGKAEAASQTPYQTYGGQRLTEATPEQQAARAGVAGLGPAQQFGTATGLATQAGQAGLAAGQYQPGVFATPLTQAQRLRQYQAAGPGAVQTGLGSFTGEGTAEQFMSPYMQNVVNVQQREAIRAAQQGQLAQNLAAARAGTYGGARQTLATTERERNLQDQLAKIQATGSQAAYDAAQRAFEQEQARGLQAGLQTQQLGTQTGLQNLQARLGVQQLGAQQAMESQRANQQALLEAQRMAEQSRQFGGTLGLQGAQAATQAAGTLGQLGTTGQAAELQRLQAQEQFGGLGQREKQAALDMAYQDFIRQQQYPYAQLGFMSDILRGSANLAQTGSRAIYETPPSMGAQLLGLASTVGGAYLGGGGKLPFAEGGEVKGLSGIKGYAEGGEVSDVIEDMADVNKLTPDQIKGLRQSKARPDVPDFVLLAQLDKKLDQIESAKAKGLPDTTVAEDIRAKATQEAAPAGIDSIPIADNYYRSEDEVAQMAGGGIVAFANGGSTFGGFEMDTVGGEEPTTSVPYEDFVGKLSLSELQEYYRSGKVPSRLKGERPTGLGSRGAPLIGTDKPAVPKQEAAPAPAPAPAKPPALKKESAGVPDKTSKKIEKAEDAYEKALREELDKTNLSKDDKMQALGFALMKFGAKAMQGRRGREFEAYGKGIEDAAESYVSTLKDAKKNRRDLTKTIAEYGLAKEGLAVRREQVAATERSGMETRRLRESMQDEALQQKYFTEYQKRYGMQPQFLKDGKPNPNWMSFETFLKRAGVSSGGGMPPSSIATPGERPAISSFRG
jgi:hypothetical protein